MKKVIERFNQNDVILVVSAWPEKGKAGGNHGIAWYTKMTLEKIADKYERRFVVLAERNGGEVVEEVCDGRGLILRVFEKKRKGLYPQILKSLGDFSRVDDVYVHSEFGVNGGVAHFVLLIPFLALVRIMGKRVTFYSHNVIEDVGELSGHLNLRGLKVRVMNLGLWAYYKFLGILCERIVVLDEALKEKIGSYIDEDKVIGLQMPVEKKRLIKKDEARRKLGIEKDKKVVLYFGFVNWYKGADWLIDMFRKTSEAEFENGLLVVAGGSSYSLGSNKYYREYYSKLEKEAASDERVRLTGYVEEEKVGLYFGAVDLVVFPYRVFMGASGSLSQAIAYEKPFMVSEVMQEGALREGKARFELSERGFGKVIEAVKSKSRLVELKKLSQELKKKRGIDELIADEYGKVFDRRELVEEKGFVRPAASVQ